MSTDCSLYTCQIGTAPFVTSDGRNYKAKHDWNLSFSFDGVSLCSVNRAFQISTAFAQTHSASIYVSDAGSVSPCNQTTTGTITPSFSESVNGYVCQIMYADIENSVYLVRKQQENITSSCTYQNPFHYLESYGGIDSVAYFPTLTRSKTITFELWINGEVKVIKPDEPTASTATLTPQPLVWPVPSSEASFFLGAAGYEWLNETFFYWYNDPSDRGWFPCLNDPTSSPGLTGYSKAESDGGKDFFIAPWLRDFAFVGVPPFQNLIAAEAVERFRNFFGGNINPDCAAPFEKTLNIDLWVSQDIVGNYLKYADKDFYSFYLPEIKQVLNSYNLPTGFLEGVDVCFPLCLL